VSSKWAGRCEECGEWNSFVEQVVEASGASAVAKSAHAGKELKGSGVGETTKEKQLPRLHTGIDDLDVVLGGGFLPGGVVLLAGQPGIGKSTLLTQIAATTSS
jgi:DNA repair protein RadA/Sms